MAVGKASSSLLNRAALQNLSDRPSARELRQAATAGTSAPKKGGLLDQMRSLDAQPSARELAQARRADAAASAGWSAGAKAARKPTESRLNLAAARDLDAAPTAREIASARAAESQPLKAGGWLAKTASVSSGPTARELAQAQRDLAAGNK